MLTWLRRLVPRALPHRRGTTRPEAEDRTARARRLAEAEHDRRHVEDEALAMGEKRRMIF